jgi:hypothetical protein
MKTNIRLIACAVALVVSIWSALRAADPPAAETGRILLLENERTLEGEVERQGDQYRVRRQVGETLVPIESVLCVCDDLETAYKFLRARANLRDADERLRLARWCHLHGLREQSVSEAQAALELRPKSAECQRVLELVQRTWGHASGAEQPRPMRAGGAEALPALEISADTMALFVGRVQPILMNTCASCHVGGRGGSFVLLRASEGGVINRRATQHNLAAVVGQIERSRWEASPLLIKSVSVHGETNQPPLKSRQTAAYRALEEWVRGTMANNPQLTEPRSTLSVKNVPDDGKLNAEQAMGGPAPTVSSSRPAVPAEGAAAATKFADPFDPAIFNQAAHPEKNK